MLTGKSRPILNGIYDLVLLDQVLSEKGLPTIEGGTTTEGSQPGNYNTTTDTSANETLPDVVS
jgi:hypothetical protein